MQNYSKRLVVPNVDKYHNLLCKHFVRRPVGQATKGRNVKIHKCDFLGCYLIARTDICNYGVALLLKTSISSEANKFKLI